MAIAILGDGDAVDQFHDKVRTTEFGCAGIQELGD